ncbi:NUDIX domain-containing protein [Oceanimonas baumannii]|uniref:NUDIX hydrolase n=1 Tax=Oceanimonas baumannii TaxID=129578 RepID=UPI001D1828A7|nr:NUDIX domain-containing protein [Oceanimonas baumannii]MCC4263710.1 NUDIX domain-containing protein [Oceanimonas baumannii]
MEIIKSVAWLYTENNKTLCVRTRGKDKFYIPGGKINKGELPEAALIREIKEELNITLHRESISPAVKIIADAHGLGSDVKVEMQCYFATHTGSISANAEIEEVKWISADHLEDCAPAAIQAIESLHERKLAYNSAHLAK